jgi:hypothetical protein
MASLIDSPFSTLKYANNMPYRAVTDGLIYDADMISDEAFEK